MPEIVPHILLHGWTPDPWPDSPEQFDTIDEAKEAAESQLKDGWTSAEVEVLDQDWRPIESYHRERDGDWERERHY